MGAHLHLPVVGLDQVSDPVIYPDRDLDFSNGSAPDLDSDSGACSTAVLISR